VERGLEDFKKYKSSVSSISFVKYESSYKLDLVRFDLLKLFYDQTNFTWVEPSYDLPKTFQSHIINELTRTLEGRNKLVAALRPRSKLFYEKYKNRMSTRFQSDWLTNNISFSNFVPIDKNISSIVNKRIFSYYMYRMNKWNVGSLKDAVDRLRQATVYALSSEVFVIAGSIYNNYL